MSYRKPTDRTIIYKVIHRSSAVRSKCSALDMLLVKLKINKKKRIKYKLISPINIFYTLCIKT